MRNLIFLKLPLYLVCLLFIFSCQENELWEDNEDILQGPIETRAGECDFCYVGVPVETCCCKITSNQMQTIDLYICGVYNGNNINNCSMDTGGDHDECYDVWSTKGIHRSLTHGSSIYFCIQKDEPFTLYNANGSGQGYIHLDCAGNPTVPPGGQYGINLSYSDGSFVRYFNSDTSCDLTPCDY